MTFIRHGNRSLNWNDRKEYHPIINFADLYDDYVIIDDNQPVYQVRKFDHLSNYREMRVENITVPLYKRAFLDAQDAYATVKELLKIKGLRIDEWIPDFLQKNEEIVVRLFMASSTSYKKFRVEKSTTVFAKGIYAAQPLPKFIWVAELYRLDDYIQEKGAFGEMILDATSAPNHGYRSLILLRYLYLLSYKHVKDMQSLLMDKFAIEEKQLIESFEGNLRRFE